MNKPRAFIPLAFLGVLFAACNHTTPEGPVIYTVGCSTSDLIAAVNQANAASGPAEIVLAADCEYLFTSVNNTQNIDGVAIPSALPAITGEIKLVGNNASLSTNSFESVDHFGLFLVSPEGYLKTDKLTMKDGIRPRGGAVYINRGKAYFDETTFRGNLAQGAQIGNVPAEGGAIYNRGGSLTVIGKSVFDFNHALNSYPDPDVYGVGGAIFSSNSFLLVIRTTFEENGANIGGGIAIRRTAGGTGEDGTFISGSEFLKNNGSAIDAEGERTAFYISGVDFTQNQSYNSGGALRIKDSILDLSGGGFVENTAETCGAVDSSQNSELLVSSSMFYKNTADGSGGAFCHSGNSLKFINSKFFFNQSGSHGGGVYATRWFAATDSVFGSNTADEYGGGIYAGDSVDILRSSIYENTAFWGGGLYAGWGPTGSSGPQIVVTVRQSSFSSNHAVRPAGGQSASVGGGIAFAGFEMKIEQSAFWANQSADAGGGLYIRRGIVEVVNSTISNNMSADGAAAFMTANSRTSFLHVTMFDNVPSAGVVLIFDAPTTIKNSAVVSGAGIVNCYLPFGTNYLTAEGENLESRDSCDGFSVINANPVFLDITDNGGPTLTNMPAPGSPALDAAADCGGLTVDQRGQPRPFGSACDLGAVELDQNPLTQRSLEITPSESAGRCEYTAIVNASCRAGDDARTQLIKVLTKGDMLELLALNPELTHGLFALPDGRSCWVWLPLMEGPADPRKDCNATIVDPEPYVPEGPACSADLPKAQCEAAGGTMSGASSSASKCICPSVASVTDPSTGPQSAACAGTGDRAKDPSVSLDNLGTLFSILRPKFL
jgi:predicted outer membrane repeat protein